jgi:hypothetical protein
VTHTPLKDQHARSPVNRTAARVVSRGVDWKPALPCTTRTCSEVPIPTSPIPYGVEDLMGRQCGRLIVVGYHSTGKRDGGGRAPFRRRWVCRCACGWYTIRLGSSIKRGSDTDECCDRCQHLKHLRRGGK